MSRCAFLFLGVLFAAVMWSGLVGSAVAAAQPSVAPSPSDPTAQLDQEKRELEITKLRQDTSSAGQFRSYIPLLSVLVALTAGGFGLYRYVRERREDYALRVEQDIAANIQHIVEYTKTDNQLNAQLSTALDNLTWLVAKAEDPRRYRERITNAMVVAVQDDVDFDDPKQARMERFCFEQWDGYRQRLLDDPDVHKFVVYRYRQALANLRNEDPEYFSTIKLGPDGEYEVTRYTEEKYYQHFLTLVGGYRQHVEAMPSAAMRRTAVADFEEALQNARLAGQLFGPGTEINDEQQTSSPATPA